MTKRPFCLTLLTALLLMTVAWASLFFGSYRVEEGGIWQVLTGGGSGLDQYIVLNQRLPRLGAALAVGAALGLAGAIFQAASRNALGSPDIIGFTTGSATGALGIILLDAVMDGSKGSGLPSLGVGLGAVMGGFFTAALVLLLTGKSVQNGQVSMGHQLVLVGIAVGAMLSSVNDYLLTRADLEAAETAKTWLYGSLNALTWWSVLGPFTMILLCLPTTLLLTRRLRILELGDDLAAGLGLAVRPTTHLLIGMAVLLTALAISLGGPIGFLALMAPQLATRVWKTPGIALWQSSLLGATLLPLADFIAARALSPFQIPVGLVMGAVGGLYLIILLLRSRD